MKWMKFVILAVYYQLKQLKKQPEKKYSGLNGIQTHDLAIPMQCLSTELPS